LQPDDGPDQCFATWTVPADNHRRSADRNSCRAVEPERARSLRPAADWLWSTAKFAAADLASKSVSPRPKSAALGKPRSCSQLPSNRRPLLRELHEQLQSLSGVSGIDGIGSQRHGVANTVRVSGCNQRGGGVEQ